jgi:4-hydroxy-4-methyl-2-oxoglutarate aldolase
MSAVEPRLAALQVSTLCDADKALTPLDPGIRLIAGPATLAGRARTLVAPGDHLATLIAVAEAEPGDVLVVQTDGGARAIAGELFATEAVRRGIAGFVVDGNVRDSAGLREIGLPVWARGTYPASGTTAFAPEPPGSVLCGGRLVRDGDAVLADDDGVLIAPEAQLLAALDRAEAIEAAEQALLAGMAEGRSLASMTNLVEHVAALRAGRPSALEFRV